MDVNESRGLLLQIINGSPFVKFLGLTRDSFDLENGRITLPWREEFVREQMTKVLHGGVISAILDVQTGFLILLHLANEGTLSHRLAKGGTIDLLVDYLLPGRGRYFVASGNIRRVGKKIAVIETELHSDKQELVALGRATFMVG